MLRRTRQIAFVGFILFLTGLILTGLQGYFTALSSGLCIAGLIFSCAIFISRVSRNFGLYANVALYSIFYIACLLVLFLLIQRHPYTYDATQSKIHSLSTVTRSFLKNRLDQPINVMAFLTDADRESAAETLGEFARYSHEFTYEIHDPFRDVQIARRYGNVMPGDIFVESLTSGTETSSNIVRLQKLTEEELTNAIVQLLRGKQVVLYFLSGHGELTLQEDRAGAVLAGKRVSTRNAAELANQLERNHIRAVPLLLPQRNLVPADATAVVCAAPKTDISKSEEEILRTYIAGGGKAIFLLNPDVPQVGGEPHLPLRNLSELLEEFGILLPKEMILRPLQQSSGGDIFSFPVQFKEHRITRDLDPSDPLFFTQARPVIPASSTPANIRLETVLLSPADTVRVPMEKIARAYVMRQDLKLKPQPSEFAQHSVGVALTLQPAGAPEEAAARVAVFGNGNFVSSEVLDQAGWLLFLNSVNWISNSGDLIAIPSSQIQNTPIVLKSSERQFLFLLLVIIVPGLIAFFGLGYSITRRELS
jgi:hypothetical protein